MEFELRNQLKSQSLDDLEPTSIKQVGGVVFPDRRAKFDLDDFKAVIESFRSVHLPTYGHIIPSSNGYVETSISSATTTKVLTPEKNEVIEVCAFQCTSAQAGTDVVLRLQQDSNDLVISTNITLTQNVPTALVGVKLKNDTVPLTESIKVAYPYSLAIQTLSSGTVDLAVKILTNKTMQ